MRIKNSGASVLAGSVRSPPLITWGSTWKAQSPTMIQSRVWVMVWTDWGMSAPSMGHHSTGPSPSQRTTWSWPQKVLTVQSTSRSGSMTGWAELMTRGRIGWAVTSKACHWSRWPTSPR